MSGPCELIFLLCFIYIYIYHFEHYNIFLDLKDAILFLQCPFFCAHFHYFACTLCMYVMCLTSLTDYFDDNPIGGSPTLSENGL